MILSIVAAALLAAAQPAPTPQPTQTATGIPLDAPWKVTVYDLALAKFHHPAWGWQHSERNYRIALELAAGDGLKVDTDVLFAAAFLHDMAAFMPCEDAKLEHGECAALQSGAILQAAGFPMEKVPAVQAAERGHMYYSDPGTQPEAIVLHDADSLDFLGEIGAARMLSLTGENAQSFARAVKALRTFVHDIPPRLITKTAQKLGAQRAAALERFLDALNAETFDGKAM
ncbi:MAG: HD domain-containing protein [Candidatus Cybelea sp.]|jgi:uncharacterized protein